MECTLSFIHTCTDTQLQEDTLTPVLHEQELFEMTVFLSPFRLAVKTPMCKATVGMQMQHVTHQQPQWETAFATENLGNLSHAAPLVAVPRCSRLATSLCLVCALFIERHGGWTPFTHKEEQNKDEIQVRSHPETRRPGLACEHRPPQRCGYFWSCKGFTQWVYITGIPLVSALKRNGSSRWAELKQLSVTFRRNINRLYKFDIFLFDLSGPTMKAISLQ